MSLTLVLSVGSDSLLLQSRNLLLQSAGYIVVSAPSAMAAIRSFRDGDFDLVLLDHTLSKHEQKRVTRFIRASGSRTPIISICAGFEEVLASTDSTIKNDPDSILTAIREALANSLSAAPPHTHSVIHSNPHNSEMPDASGVRTNQKTLRTAEK